MSESGRKTVLDEAKRGELCGLIASGVSLRQAARCVGCDPHTIRREMRRNNAFREEIERSKKLVETAPFRALMDAAKTNWRAAAWVLERLRPELFGRKRSEFATQTNIQRFVGAICDVIDECSTHSIDRDRLHQLLGHIMPAEMRSEWDRQQAARRRIVRSGISWRIRDQDHFSDSSGNPRRPATESSPQFASPAGEPLQNQAAASPPRRNDPEFASQPTAKLSDFQLQPASREAKWDAFRPENEIHSPGRNEQDADATD